MSYLLKRTAVITLLAMISALSAYGARIKIGNIYYLLSGTEASVTYGGTSATSGTEEYTGAIEIPSVVTNDGKNYAVSAIDGYAFCKCADLTTVTIPTTVKTIGQCAFNGCTGITTFIIPSGVTTIGVSAFGNATSLSSVTIGCDVVEIDDEAFYKCPVSTVVSFASTPPTMGNDVFSKYSFALTVPENCAEAYKADATWGMAASIVEVTKVKATSISFGKDNKAMLVSKTFLQMPEISPAEASNQTLKWSSSDNSVATVDISGDVTAIAMGSAVITAETTDGSGLSASYKVYVFEPGIPGDVNGDGEITIADANAIVNMFLTK